MMNNRFGCNCVILECLLKVCRSLATQAGCIAASVGRAFSRICLCVCMSVCLSVCPRSKRKTTWAINTKLGTRYTL